MNNFELLPQFIQGKNVERYLDTILERLGYLVVKTTLEEERKKFLGDRCILKEDGIFYIEYKSGIQTHYTGNIFLETISVDIPNNTKLGWVFTCQADFIYYATLLEGCILVFKPDILRIILPVLKTMFPERCTSRGQNNGYNTHGLIIPFEWAKENLACSIIDLTVL